MRKILFENLVKWPVTEAAPEPDDAAVAELKSAILEYLESHNANPKPFVWTKSASQILEKVVRAKQVLESQHYRNPSSASRKTERRIIVVVGHITLIVTLLSSELS